MLPAVVLAAALSLTLGLRQADTVGASGRLGAAFGVGQDPPPGASVPSPAGCVEAVLVEPRRLASIAPALESAALASVSDQQPERRIDVLTIAHGSLNAEYVNNLVHGSPVLGDAERSGRLRLFQFDMDDLGGDRRVTTSDAGGTANSSGGGNRSSRMLYHDKYSRLIKSPEFWGRLSCDRVLLMQSDSILCHNSQVHLAEFLDQEYIGGQTPHMGYGERFHMNGGFSFRNRNAMLRCIEGARSGSVVDDPTEDGFFSRCQELRQPDVSTMDRFAIDNGMKEINESSVPLGVHKPWSASGQFRESNMRFCEGAGDLAARMKE